MANGFVQNGGTTITDNTGVVCHPTISGVTANNTLICCYAVNNQVSLSAPTDSNGDTWSLAVNFNNDGSAIAIAYVLAATSGTHTLSWAVQSHQQSSSISEWSGITAVGGTASTNAAFAVATLGTGTYTPSQANEVVIACGMEQGSTNPDNISCSTAAFQSIGSSSDANSHSCIGINQNGTTSNGYEANAQIVTSTAGVSATYVWTPTENAIAAIQGFKFNPTVTSPVLLGQICM